MFRFFKLVVVALSLVLVWSGNLLADDFGTQASGKNFQSTDANFYLSSICEPQFRCALALSSDGFWAAARNGSLGIAKSNALARCRRLSGHPNSCSIVDSDGKSDFVAVQGGRSQQFGDDPFDNSLKPDGSYRLVSTGTGFVVNPNYVVTADHVLRRNQNGDLCSKMTVVYRKDKYEARIVDSDPSNDLGLLKLSTPITSSAKLRSLPNLRLGETAVTYGFPLLGTLSNSPKITSGSVNSLAGFNNNSSFIQYDAASQHGNSGGPLLDASGNVIGVISAKLDDGSTQLVNFAAKATVLETYLDANGIEFETVDLVEKLELPDIAEKAEAFTVLVGCWE